MIKAITDREPLKFKIQEIDYNILGKRKVIHPINNVLIEAEEITERVTANREKNAKHYY